MRKKYLLLLLFVLFASSAFSQISKTHYIPPITSNGPSTSNTAYIGEQWIYISTPSINKVEFTITDINNGSIISGEVKNDEPYSLLLSSDESSSGLVTSISDVGNTTNSNGYVVNADCPVYVSIRFFAFPNLWQAGAFSSKGSSGLGTHFRTAMMPMGNKTTPVLGGSFTS